MTKIEIPNLLAHFAGVPDPRDPRDIRRDFSDIKLSDIKRIITHGARC